MQILDKPFENSWNVGVLLVLHVIALLFHAELFGKGSFNDRIQIERSFFVVFLEDLSSVVNMGLCFVVELVVSNIGVPDLVEEVFLRACFF